MKVKIIGKNKPFWDGKLRSIGDTVDVPKELMDAKNPPSWAKAVRTQKTEGSSQKG